jgi:hypothetical protein
LPRKCALLAQKCALILSKINKTNVIIFFNLNLIYYEK